MTGCILVLVGLMTILHEQLQKTHSTKWKIKQLVLDENSTNFIEKARLIASFFNFYVFICNESGDELNHLILGTGYDLVLNGLGQVVEVCAVACDTDDKVSVVFGVLLCITESFVVNNVELDMLAAVGEICLYQRGELCQILVGLECAGMHLHIQKHCIERILIDLHCTAQRYCRTLGISALCR